MTVFWLYVWGSIFGRGKDFSHHDVQNRLWGRLTYNPLVIGGYFTGAKEART
jgi:hypothetical protein